MNRRQRRRRAQILQLLCLGPPMLAGISWLIGLAISPIHREEALRRYPSSPDALWGALTDLDGMPNWRTDLASIERLPMADGTVRWLEIGSSGRRTVFERTAAVQQALLVIRQRGSRTDQRWTFRIEARDDGTELRLTEERTIRNPLFRTLVKLFGSDRDRIEGLTDDLQGRLAGHRQRVAVIDHD